MLWAEEVPDLDINYPLAFANFLQLEKKLGNNAMLKERYSETIKVDLEKGYVREVPKHELLATRNEMQNYVPHHAVTHPLKPEKVRRVCNAASKYKGRSLNDHLMTGPDLLNNLFGILIRFRNGSVAVIADIEAMFLQVGVPERDQKAIRFLWREDPSEQMKVLQYLVHIFGAKDSPTCANYALKRCGRDNAIEYPKAAKVVQETFYMDDLPQAENTVEEMNQLCLDLHKVLKYGGFNLTKWFSNSCEVQEFLEQNGFLLAKVPEHDPHIFVLGLKWFPNADYLLVSRGTKHEVPDQITQRKILSIISSIFDPLGVIAPFTIRGRLLLKSVWQCKGQRWDSPVEDEEKQQFLTWLEELSEVESIQLPRNYFRTKPESYQLHVFGDASSVAMSAVVYLRAALPDGSIELAFVMGKSRVAPIRKITVPKLELQAALIASRLYEMIRKEIDIEIEKSVFWSDSSTTLQWIASSNKKQQTLVGNRVAEILQVTTVDQWRFIPGNMNPADCGTRGLSVPELKECPWLIGPKFLLEQEENWPTAEFPVKEEKSKNSGTQQDYMQLDIAPELFFSATDLECNISDSVPELTASAQVREHTAYARAPELMHDSSDNAMNMSKQVHHCKVPELTADKVRELTLKNSAAKVLIVGKHDSKSSSANHLKVGELDSDIGKVGELNGKSRKDEELSQKSNKVGERSEIFLEVPEHTVMSVFTQNSSTNANIWHKFSKFSRLRNVIAWCLRFASNCKNKDKQVKKTYITVAELQNTEKLIWILIQREEFPNELRSLSSGTQIPTSSKVKSLTPFIAEDGILRAKGRLQNANALYYDMKYPIILPSNHIVVRLYLKKLHLDHYHQGN